MAVLTLPYLGGGANMSLRLWRSGEYWSGRKLKIAFLACALILAGCGTSSSAAKPAASTSTTTAASSKSPYVVHAILSLTGPGATLGSIASHALTAFAAYVNQSGGIDGHKVTLDIINNQSNPATAVSQATNLIHSGVPFLLNGSISPVDNAVDALAGSTGPVIYDLSPVANPKPHSYVFAAGISTKYLEGSIVNFMKVSGYNRIAIINSSDASGLDGYNELEAALKSPSGSGVTVISHQTYDPTALNVVPQMSAIKATNPQAIFISTTGTPFGTVLRAMSSLGMTNVPTFATSGNALQSELTSLSSILPAHLYLPLGPLYFPPSSLPTPLQSYLTVFDKVVTAAGGQPNTGWGLPVDAFMIMVRALKSLGVKATAPQLKNYLQTKVKNVPESFGLYNISAQNHVGTSGSDVWIGQWNGKSFSIVSGKDGTTVAK